MPSAQMMYPWPGSTYSTFSAGMDWIASPTSPSQQCVRATPWTMLRRVLTESYLSTSGFCSIRLCFAVSSSFWLVVFGE